MLSEMFWMFSSVWSWKGKAKPSIFVLKISSKLEISSLTSFILSSLDSEEKYGWVRLWEATSWPA